MAQMTPQKYSINEFNGGTGNEYGTQIFPADDLTMAVENSVYAAEMADALVDAPDVSDAGTVGTPTVTLIDNVKNGVTYKKFKFSNIKGDKGDKGNTGETGAGVPSGGSTGQYIVKTAGGGTEWKTPSTEPTQNGTEMITTGAVYTAINDINTRLTNLGFRQGSVSLSSGITAQTSINRITRQGNYVIGLIQFQSPYLTIAGDNDSWRTIQIGTLPENFRPSTSETTGIRWTCELNCAGTYFTDDKIFMCYCSVNTNGTVSISYLGSSIDTAIISSIYFGFEAPPIT